MRIVKLFPIVLVVMTACASEPINRPAGYSGVIKKVAPSSTATHARPDVMPSVAAQPRAPGVACRVDVARDKPLTQEEIRACMDINNGKLQAIYQRSLRSDPTIKGTIIFRMKISSAGDVVGLEVDPRTETSKEFTEKILDGMRAIKFPPSTSEWNDNYTLNFFPS